MKSIDEMQGINFFGEDLAAINSQKNKRLLKHSGFALPFAVILVFFLVYLIGGQFLLHTDSILDSSDCTLYEGVWTYEEGNNLYSLSFPASLENGITGEAIDFTTRLPDDLDDGDGIMYWNMGQNFSVLAEGRVLYTYTAEKELKEGFNSPFVYHIIPLSEEYAGKELTLEVEITTTAYQVGEVYIGSQTAMLLYAFRQGQIEIMAAICMLMAGLVSIGICVYIRFKTKRSVPLLYLGVGISLISLWLILNSRIRQFIFPNVAVARNGAFFIIALLMLPLLIYVDRLQKRRYHRLYHVMEALCFLNFIFLFAGNLLELLPFSYGFFPTEVLAMTGIGVVLATFLRDVFLERLDYKVSAVGLGGMGAACGIHLIFYIIIPSNHFSSYFLILGLIFLLVCATANMIRDLMDEEQEKNQVIRSMQHLSIQAMESLARAVDAKDRYTSGHSERVAIYSRRIAKKMGKTEEEQEYIYYVGLLHDVGKIGIDDRIIRKDSKLTDEEYEAVKNHTRIGAGILENITEIPGLEVGAHWHHERYDGNGFPDGLKGEEIPEIARIVCVADTYDAMTSKRSYRDVLPQGVVREEIQKCSGTQFDPKIASIMLELIDEDVDYLMREFPAKEDNK